MNKEDILKQIDDFEAHYKYDSTYMRELLETSPMGYDKFNNAMPLVSHRELLDTTSYWISKLAAMRAEDCGDCLQLNVRMALEDGVDKEIVSAVVNGGAGLTDDLKDVYYFSIGVAENSLNDFTLIERIESRFDKGQLLEFGLSISTAKFFPTTKRAVGYTRSCSIVDITV